MSEQSSPVLEDRSCATMTACAGGLASSMNVWQTVSTGGSGCAGASSMSTGSRSNTLRFRLMQRTLDQLSVTAQPLSAWSKGNVTVDWVIEIDSNICC